MNTEKKTNSNNPAEAGKEADMMFSSHTDEWTPVSEYLANTPKDPWYRLCFIRGPVRIGITPMRWGAGIDIGFDGELGVCVWLGPFFVGIEFS